MLRHVLLLLSLVMICACNSVGSVSKSESAQTETSTKAVTMMFECENDLSFVARLEGQTLWAFLPQQTLALEPTRTASGAKYQKAADYVWLKGDNAMVNYQQTLYKNCVNNRQEAIWQDAKFRGVSFRAVGNEPGWLIEITPNVHVKYFTNYGRFETVLPYKKPIETEQSSMFELTKNQNTLLFEIINKPCTDTMSGQKFASSVRGQFNGKAFSGCGRALF